MTEAPARRAVLLGGLLALAGCSRAGAGATAATSSARAEPALVDALELKDRMLIGVGTATARIRVRRARTDSGRLGWTAEGPVSYGSDGFGTALLDVVADAEKVRLLVRRDAVFVRRSGRLSELDLDGAPVDALTFLTEIRRAVPLVGQAAFVPGSAFRGGATGPDGRRIWSASVSREELSTSWPAGVLDQYQGILSSMDVLLTLDADDRPVGRVDTARPNSVQLTVETSWSDWGTAVTIPAPDGG